MFYPNLLFLNYRFFSDTAPGFTDAGLIIEYGIRRLDNASRKYLLLNSERDRLTALIGVLPWIPESSVNFGIIKADLEQRGLLIDDFDITIAAIAMSHKCSVVTANVDHLQRIRNLISRYWK